MATLNVVYRIAADITNLQNGVQQGVGTMERMEKSARQLGAALGSMFSVEKFAAAADASLRMAGHIDDLARKVGVSAEAVQELDFVAKQSGSSFDEVSRAIGQMANRLGEGDTSAVGALQLMGLRLSDLLNMQPDQAFQTIATAIAQIPDPMERSRVAMDIFGRQGAELLPVLTSDIVGLRDRARDMGLVLSNEVVASGDATGDSFEALQGKLNTLKASALLPLLEQFQKLPEPMQTVLGLGYEMAPSLSGIGIAIMAAGGPTAALGMLSGAFAAILPFLGPIGLIAAGVAAVVLAWQHWDEIVTFVTNVYDAVKTWIIDKLSTEWVALNTILLGVAGWFSDMATNSVEFATQLYDGVTLWLIDNLGAEWTALETSLLAVVGWFSDMATDSAEFVADIYRAVKTWLIDELTAEWSALETSVLAVAGWFSDMATDSVAFVTQMSRDVKSWLVDKFADVSMALEASLLTVAGWFSDMATKSVAFVKQMYEGVKAWLVDKFQGIVDSIKAKVDAITGFFKDMYDKVVGSSFVPDMVTQIGAEFGRLEGVMVNPARTATDGVEGIFSGMTQRVSQMISGWLGNLGGMMGGWLQNFLPSFGQSLNDGLSGVMSGVLGGLGSMLTGGLSGLIGAGIGAIGGLFSGGEEAKFVNPARDSFIGQFGPAGTGEGSGFHNLAALLTSLTGEEGGGSLFHALASADSMGEFSPAVEAIRRLLEQNGMHGFRFGTHGQFLDFGTGTPVMLHGRERVQTQAEAGSDGLVLQELRAVRRALDRQADAIGIAVRDEMMKVFA